MKIFAIVFVSLVLITLSCGVQENSKKKAQNFISEIPVDHHGKQSLLESIKLMRDSLKLDTLENGFDSLQIRIWISYSFTDTQQVLILKKYDFKWQFSYCRYTPVYDDRVKKLRYFDKYQTKVAPKTSYNNFINVLYSNHIMDLPDYHKLRNYEAPTDPNNVSIEISTKYEYRLYSYPAPHIVVGFAETKKIENILNLINTDLGIEFLSKL